MSREEQALILLQSFLQAAAPYREGHLVNSIKISSEYDKLFIIIGGEPAPYAAFTNEPWSSLNWHGRKNPNEGWVERAIKAATPALQKMLSGAMTKEEYDKILKKQKLILEDTRKRRASEIREYYKIGE